MATPRVFVSSTCYDLKYIRENLKFFIRTLGYEPILSEDGDVFYNPKLHTHDSCLSEIETCQLFVLIIGGRYGGKFKSTDKSITNQEYQAALLSKTPIFALVEHGVYSEHHVYQKNKANKTINYPSVDNAMIFDFIDEVRKNITNNAIVPFRDFSDMEIYLKKQWAGMMYYYLTSESESRKVSDLLNEISNATQKIEYFTKNIAVSTGNAETKLDVKLYDTMLGADVVSTLAANWELKVTPRAILLSKTIDEFCGDEKIKIVDGDGHTVYGGNDCRLSKKAYESYSKRYIELRDDLIKIIDDSKITIDDYLKRTDSN